MNNNGTRICWLTNIIVCSINAMYNQPKNSKNTTKLFEDQQSFSVYLFYIPRAPSLLEQVTASTNCSL